MSENKNGRLGLYGAEHSKCNHMMTLDFNKTENSQGCNTYDNISQYAYLLHHFWLVKKFDDDVADD